MNHVRISRISAHYFGLTFVLNLQGHSEFGDISDRIKPNGILEQNSTLNAPPLLWSLGNIACVVRHARLVTVGSTVKLLRVACK